MDPNCRMTEKMLCLKLDRISSMCTWKKNIPAFNIIQNRRGILLTLHEPVFCVSFPEFLLGIPKGLYSVKYRHSLSFFFFLSQTTPCLATISYHCLSSVTQKEHTLQKHGKTLTPARLCMWVRMHSTGMTNTFLQPKNWCSLYVCTRSVR